MHRSALLCVGVLLLSGCSSSPATLEGSAPRDLAVTIRMSSKDLRYTMLELQRDGTLLFGGGSMARFGDAAPVMVLTQRQREQVWQLIVEHDLLNIRTPPSMEAVKTQWQVRLQGGGRRRAFRFVDDQAPGAVALHDLLFQFQAAVRYNLPGL